MNSNHAALTLTPPSSDSNNRWTMSNVVDLTEDDDANPPQNQRDLLSQDMLRMRIAMAPEAKPSVRYGPGRGRGVKKNWFRPYFDNAVTQKRNHLNGIVLEAMKNHGCKKIPAGVPVAMRVWFFPSTPRQRFHQPTKRNWKIEAIGPDRPRNNRGHNTRHRQHGQVFSRRNERSNLRRRLSNS